MIETTAPDVPVVKLTRQQLQALHVATHEYARIIDRLMLLKEATPETDRGTHVIIKHAMKHAETAHSKVSYVIMAESLKGWK